MKMKNFGSESFSVFVKFRILSKVFKIRMMSSHLMKQPFMAGQEDSGGRLSRPLAVQCASNPSRLNWLCVYPILWIINNDGFIMDMRVGL
ncbi:hypothetical protein CapIbe_011211 [Capra ibex]